MYVNNPNYLDGKKEKEKEKTLHSISIKNIRKIMYSKYIYANNDI